jgi:hypothetical protein
MENTHFSIALILNLRGRFTLQSRSLTQTPAKTKRQEAEPARKTFFLAQTARLQVETTPFQRLKQRLNFPAVAIVSQEIARFITNNY